MSDDQKRRTFLAVAAVGGSAIAAVVGAPALGFVAAPAAATDGKGARFVVAKLSDLEVGIPKRVVLSAAALRASAAATAARIGSGQWMLALPAAYIAGVQVLGRSLLAGIDPVLLEGRFTPDAFVRATATLRDGVDRFTSFVPAQLATLLDAANEQPGVRAALASYRAILVGGQALPERQPQVAPPAPTADETPAEVDRRPVRLLLVEDHAEGAEMLATLLKLWGHEVRVARDGPSALAAVVAEIPEMILLDLGLPRMNGYEVAERLRDHHGPETPFLVALTGYGRPEDRTQALGAGFDYHLVKPVDLDALGDLVARLGAPTRAGHPTTWH